MKQIIRRAVFTAMLALVPALAHANAISLYYAPHEFQNSGVNPCIFSGNGNNGCGTVDFPFPAWTDSTQQFTPNPLVNNIDPGSEIAQFATNIGREFFLGLDMNQAGNTVQTISEMTITFRDVNGNVLGSGYQLAPTPAPFTVQGEGWTDYVAAAGCLGTLGAGNAVAGTCTNYAPFIAPVGTRAINFTYGMGVFNDGAERVFLIKAGPTAVPFSDPPTSVPDGGATMAMLGVSMVGLGYLRRKFSI